MRHALVAPTFVHRTTNLPGADPTFDRVVLCGGRPVGRVVRVVRVENGPAAGEWMWSGFWITNGNRGRAATLDEALAAIKQRATPEALEQLPPRYWACLTA